MQFLAIVAASLFAGLTIAVPTSPRPITKVTLEFFGPDDSKYSVVTTVDNKKYETLNDQIVSSISTNMPGSIVCAAWDEAGEMTVMRGTQVSNSGLNNLNSLEIPITDNHID
jgi:hypothetical protein